MIRSQR